MQPFMYYNPTKLLFGKGQIDQLSNEIGKYGRKILLVYGGGSIKRNGVYEKITYELKKANVEWVELMGVASNPKLSTVRRGIDICKREKIDFILAVGGGSVIDCTKAIVVGARTEADVWNIICRKTRAIDGIPYGSIVTLAGTGAELSLSAVISNEESKEKRAFVSSFSRAKFSIVDPTLMISVPRKHTINGVVDTMSHLLEHYFHHGNNTNIQDEFLEAALRNVATTGTKLLEDLSNESYRETIAYASSIALSDQMNMGFVGDWGTHHIEHALSAVHDIPHGGGMAILFPKWMEYVLDDENVSRFKRFAVNVFGVDANGKSDKQIAQEGIESLASLWKEWGAPSSLEHYDIHDDKTFSLIAHKTMETAPNCGNFKRLQKEDVLQILQRSL
ncbi:iron-containing alcohol dehydrogenase [Pseudogracilibacillus sp. ICA-222130]|uniref:iron-containing alcohol dehydrogenase n=1 Tax=Pseudogracilibacillus sp. ICA-222130 TaxID=3134655 RepID=UPI0030C2F73C